MSEESSVKQAPDEASKRAKEDLETAVGDLVRVSQGTTMQFRIEQVLLIVQLDVCVEMLFANNLIDRATFYTKVKEGVEKNTSDVRRALLTQGAATQLVKAN